MKLNEMGLNESIASDIKRKLTGKVSGKEQIRRAAQISLQRAINDLKEIDNNFGDLDSNMSDWLVELRKELIEAIKIIKAVEK